MAKSGQLSRSVLGASDEINDIFCEPCQKDGNVSTAEFYCKDCPEYLCAQCYRSHGRNKVLSNHVLFKADTMPIDSDYNRRLLDISREKCTIHTDKVIKFFCKTCDKLGCTTCITTDHLQCDQVKSIPDITKDLKKSQEFTEFQECIKYTTLKLFEFEQNIKANATTNKERQKLAKLELKRQRDEVNKYFDELEENMDNQILQIDKRNKDAMKSAYDRLKPMKIDLDKMKKDIDAKQTGRNCELYISMTKSMDQMRSIDDQINKIQKKLSIQQYPIGQIKAMMRTTTLDSTTLSDIFNAGQNRTPTAKTATEDLTTLPDRFNTGHSRTPTLRTTTEDSTTLPARNNTGKNRTPIAKTITEDSTVLPDRFNTGQNRKPTARSATEDYTTPLDRFNTGHLRTPTARMTTEVSTIIPDRYNTGQNRTPTARTATEDYITQLDKFNTGQDRTPTARTATEDYITQLDRFNTGQNRTPTSRSATEDYITQLDRFNTGQDRTPTARTATEDYITQLDRFNTGQNRTPTARSTTKDSTTLPDRFNTVNIKSPTARTVTEDSTTVLDRINTGQDRTPTARTATEDYTTIPDRFNTGHSRTSTSKTATDDSTTLLDRISTGHSKSPTARTATERIRPSTVESVIDIKTNKDKNKPFIFGLTAIHGHYCVVADSKNKSIKVVDTKTKQVTSEIGIEAKCIWSVKSVSDDQVVVSVTFSDGQGQIQFFSVSTSGVIQGTNRLYYVIGNYKDMVHCKGNIFGICGNHDFRIDIISLTEERIRIIPLNVRGDVGIRSLQGIALSPDEQTLYVTDKNTNSVTSLTLDGNTKAVYTDKDLREPTGITVDKYGYVYVRSRGTENVQQLTADLHKVNVPIEDVVGNNITYSSTENKLYINDKDKINEYNISYIS